MNKQSLLYLWKARTLYLGHLDEPLHLSQGAATLCVCLEGTLSVTLLKGGEKSGEIIRTNAALLPPGCAVHIDTHQQLIANLNLDVMGSDYFSLSHEMLHKQSGVHFDLKNEQPLLSTLRETYQQAYESDIARARLYNFFGEQSLDNFVYDERVQTVVEAIQTSIDHNLSIEHLADSVNLSTPGLVKLFKKQTGVPIRRYRQWHRLFVTATEIGKGKSLTDAALAAGFVDLSHCTNTFNLMLGIRPSYFLKRPEEIRVLVEH